MALLMLLGFLCSRAILSMSMIAFGANALRGVPLRDWFRWRWWWLGLSWVALFALSWFWSSDHGIWNDHVQVKLPFLLLPLGFSLLPAFSAGQYRFYTLGMCGILLSGVAYSLSFFLGDPSAYIKGYSFSHVFPTPVYNDHIRFSAALALAVGWCVYAWPWLSRRWMRIVVAASCILFAAYLHLLAAKTGLLMLYGLAALLVIRQLWRGSLLKGGLLLLLTTAMLWLGYQKVPTFRERVHYARYNLQLLSWGRVEGNYSDLSRVLSYRVALHEIRKAPLMGAGAGDLVSAMNEGYNTLYPQVAQENRLVPHNQLLVVGLAAGIPALLLFLAWLFYPLSTLRRNREGFFTLAVWLLLLVPLMVEPMLEVQFGVFVYLFFLLWQWHALRKPLFGSEAGNPT